jgi:ribosomal protein S18 acetylase RimI-like enzyme
MVKAKELKLMRKRLGAADKIENPLQLLGGKASDPFFESTMDLHAAMRLSYKSSAELAVSCIPVPNTLLDQCLNLFECNMGDQYRASSWGLDMDAKRQEFQDKKARFLVVTNSNADAGSEGHLLVAFVHFRFCYDDDDSPEETVLYVYEIQVHDKFRRMGLGGRLMGLVESIAMAADLPKVMLTVFKNSPALEFYMRKLSYTIDKCSPSQHGESTDYEILSKVLKR